MANVVVDTWNINNFSGGEGDGFYLGHEGAYRIGENIDSRTLELGVRVCTKATDTTKTYDGDIKAVNPYLNQSFSTDAGKLYKNGTFTLSLSSGTPTYNLIDGFGKMTRLSDTTDYIYGFTPTLSGVGKIHRIDADFGGLAYSVGTFTLGLGRITNPAYQYMPILSLPGRIIFAYGNTIFEIDQNETVSTLLTLPKETTIVGLTYYQDTYKIYYNIPRFDTGVEDAYVAYWDGYSNLVEQFTTYQNSPTKLVMNDGANDYVVYGQYQNTDLYIVQGLQRQILRIGIEQNTQNNNRILGREGVIKEGIFYIQGTNKLTNNCLYTFGEYYPNSGYTLCSENAGLTYNKIGTGTTTIDLYVNDYNGVSGTGRIFTKNIGFQTTTEGTGTILTYSLLGNYGINTIKKLQMISIGYRLNTGQSIKIYARKNAYTEQANIDGWILLSTITDTTKRYIDILQTTLNPLGLSEFHSLEYKIELITVGGISPILYNIFTLYEDNLKKL